MFPVTSAVVHEIDRLPEYTVFGRISAIVGLLIEVEGLAGCLAIGDRCGIERRGGAVSMPRW